MSYWREHFNFLTEPGKYPGVDLLRAGAVLAVVFFHFQFLPIGWIGVDLFFVISGFLIGGVILDKALINKFSFKEFYRNRILRILPLYYLMIILATWLKAGDKPIDALAIKSIVTGMLFLQTTGTYFFPNYFTVDHSFLPGGAWSLVIEEMFYLLAPLIVVLAVVLLRRIEWVIVLLAMIFISGYFVRWKMTENFMPDDGNWHFASFIQFHSRYDELTAGLLIAAIVRWNNDLVKKYSLLFLFVSAIFLAIFLNFIYSHSEFYKLPHTIASDTKWIPTVLALAWGGALLSVYWWKIKSPVIILMARLSYPLYLGHILVLEVITKNRILPELSQWERSSIFIIASIVFAYLLSLFVEYPFVRLYKKPAKVHDIKSSNKKLSANGI